MNHTQRNRGAKLGGPARRLAARAAVAGGLVALGTAFGAFVGLPGDGQARAGDQNYVKSSSHEAVSKVRLDEDITVVFAAPLFAPSVGPDTILIRTGPTSGEQANGQFVIGKFLYDRRRFRRAVIRPEAIQEYYQLVRGNPREVATRLAASTIRRIERSGRLNVLSRIDRALVTYFDATFGAGTRLDDDSVVANFPPLLDDKGDRLSAYRTSVAGDDDKWKNYLQTVAKVEKNQVVTPEELAQAQQDIADLTSNPEYERFYHPVDPATGIASGQSVLRGREYRKVLFDRRQSSRVTFVPEVPIRPDLSDTGFKTASSYSLVVPATQPGVFNTVLTRRGLRPLLQKDGRDYSTYFTTIPGSVNSTDLFLDNDARTATADIPNQKPRIINSTPPNGDSFVDQTTDWEDPDNAFAVTESARKVFSVRIRFAQCLDPRTTRTVNVTMRKTRTAVGLPGERPVDEVKAIGVFLNQHRLGVVELEVTPSEKLDGDSEYEVVVKGQVKSLGGQVLNTDRKISFSTRSGQPPLDAIREDFRDTLNQANPLNPDNAGDVSSGFWTAPAYLDPTGTGRSMGLFMPFVGNGLGAPPDPTNPGDASEPKVKDLVLAPSQEITFATEDLDPASSNFGRQVEYNYNLVELDRDLVTTIGRYPLVIRCQRYFKVASSNILVNGAAGGQGKMNLDTVSGPPTGGLGGAPGPGGYRGGDGAGAPLTDINGNPVLDGQGRLQFDQSKFAGADGAPGYQVNGVQLGGGSGGHSGDNDYVITTDYNMDMNIDEKDNPFEPMRRREPGGGGGHATAGEDGEGAGGSQITHPVEGYLGGKGGAEYGDSAFSMAPLNFLGVPTLAAGFGGAGGGGGGLEDDAPLGVVGPEDAGGGGGGGGGGAIQICAREYITINGTLVDASGGPGGATRDALNTTEGQGAAGGCGAGGSIWLQCFEGQVTIENGSNLNAAGGDNAGSVGELTTSASLKPDLTPIPLKGKGGRGGLGYVRLEDVDGLFANLDEQVTGVIATAKFAPEADDLSYPGRGPEAPMVVNTSLVYSRWFNSRLDTPTYEAAFDDPDTPTIIEGTAFNDFFEESGGQVLIEVRTAPDDLANTGHPNLFQITPWVKLEQGSLTGVGNRRFLQFRITYMLPFNYQFTNPLPYVDYFQVNVELK